MKKDKIEGWFCIAPTPYFSQWAVGPFQHRSQALKARKIEAHMRNLKPSELQVVFLRETKP